MKYSFARDNDWLLIITTFSLAIFGLLMVFSSSYVYALYENGDYTYFFKRQAVWLILSSFAFLFVMHFPYHYYRNMTKQLFFLSIFLLILVKLIGVEVNGAQSWIRLGFFSFQPSEFVKLMMIIYLAHVYSKKNSYIDNFKKGVLPPLIAISLILVLIMLQPDLGAATVILAVTCLIVFFSGAKTRHLMGLALVGFFLFLGVALSSSYRLQRLTSFINPFKDAAESGYQVIQSYIAIAHGGLKGAGLGNSVQKLMYLPEAHTDFILSIILEELGILSGIFILVGYSIILIRGVYIGVRCKQLFGSLLAFGIVFQMMIQAIFNMGAVTGLLPITGITLPLISNGGSSLFFTMISIAILANISRYNIREKHKHEKELVSA